MDSRSAGSVAPRRVLLHALPLLLVSVLAHAQPGNVVLSHVAPVPIEQADQALRARTPVSATQAAPALATPTPTVAALGASCAGPAQAPEIAALAAGLKCDTDLIFEYVYNNITYEPLFGSNKGALGTLLDQRGNDIDQANLLVALLTAAGIPSSQLNLIYGYIRITGATGPGWLGVANNAAQIANLLAGGGIPIGTYYYNPDGTLAYVDVAHVWVQVGINSTNYVFDPSFKQRTLIPGETLGSILGYARSQFLADAGGTVTSTSYAGVNRANVRADLVTYANNLATAIATSGSSWSVADLVGGSTIQPLTGSPIRQTALPYLSPSQPPGFPQNWGASVPNAYRACFTVAMPGVTPQTCAKATAQTILLYADQTYGERITVFSVPSGSNYVPTLLIAGAPPPNGQNTGTPEPAGVDWAVGVNITHPYANAQLAAAANQSGTLTIAAGGSYLVGAGWGQVGRGMIAKHRTLLAQARASGGGASELVLGETLAVISYNFLAENASTQRLLDAIGATTTQYHHGMGITGYAAIQGQSATQGPYVDLALNFYGITPQAPSSGLGLSPLFISTLLANGGIFSALESAVLEQTQALVPGITAASTVHLVDQNVGAGNTTYFADGTTAAGVSAYFTSIRGHLSSYNAGDLSTIDHDVSSDGTVSGSPTGKQVLAPANGNQQVGLWWHGAGYSVLTPGTNSYVIEQRITGGLSGGFAGINVPSTVPPGSPNPTVSSSTASTTTPPAGALSIPAGVTAQPSAPGNPSIAEPVDAITGAYVYHNADLTLGSGVSPYSLQFARTYSSAVNTVDLGLGNGWSQSYGISALRTSDPYAGLGEGSATNVAAAVAALYVAQDLLTPQPVGVQNLTLAWLVSQWLTDQLTNNAVLVSEPGTSEEFVALPRSDGATNVTYSPPLGSATIVTGSTPDTYGNPTVFAYRMKDLQVLSFNPVDVTNTGSLASLALPNGTSLSFTYGYAYNGLNYLTRIANNLGRGIALAWNGNHITLVADGTGRSVAYGYDGAGNLVSFTDPAGNVTRFGYDGASRLTQITYPAHPANAFVTNSYDAIGRVSGQANANGFATTFNFAGTRTETADAAGDRHVTYQTPRGKVLKDVAVLNPTFGDVFNDTAQQAGLAVTTNAYDGQDRVTLATAPSGITTSYTWSPDFEQNLIQRTITPPTGSPLAPVSTTYAYDPTYNKVSSIIDPLALVTTMSYDPATGNLIQVIEDAGAAGHFNRTSRFSYDGHGLLLTATDPLNVVTQNSYDGFGNLTSSVADANGLKLATLRGYDAAGNVLTLTDPNGNTASFSYDADRRVLSVTAPVAGTTPTLVTANTYDPDGNLVQAQQSAAGTVLRTTAASYTYTDKVASTTDANGNVTRFGYDVVDRLASVTDPVGRITVYAYDALSRQISVSNPAIQANPLLATAYTPDGLVASLTDANGNAIAYAYDGLDRLGTTTYADASTESYTYDANSNMKTRVTRRGDTIGFAYDTLNRLISKTEPAGTPSVSYGYDLVGRLISVSDNGPALVAATPATSFAETASYDALNRPVSTSWSPAASQTAPAAASGVAFAFAYDASNRRIGQTANDNTWISYPGPTSSTAYTPNALNQYSKVGAANPTYDANGNLTFDGSVTYAYDAESRLVSVTQGGTTVATYVYDGRGRRKSRTTGGATTVYVTGAEDQDLLEYNGATGAPSAIYAVNLRGGIDDVLNRVMPGGPRQTLVPDIQGSIIASLDSGGTLSKIAYQGFGESPSAVAAGAGPRYTAQRLDPETAFVGGTQPNGLYYYRARMYSPTWGRFLQPDPIGPAGGINLYAYVGNDSLNLTDSLGLCDNPAGCGRGSINQLLPEPGLTSPCIECLVVPALKLPEAVGALYEAFQLYRNLPTPSVSQNMGDLTQTEINQIQSVVDQAGRPIEVVGSAARSARQAGSDIDYVAPPSSLQYFEGLEKQLPGIDPTHGIVPGVGNPNIGPVIRFEPR